MSIKRIVTVVVMLLVTVISASAQSPQTPEDLRRAPKRARYIFPVAPRADVVRAAPPNDNFANATVVNPTLPYVDTVLNFDQATGEVDEPDGCINAANGIASVWYSYTPTANMAVTLSTYGSSFDTVIGLYTGASVGALTGIRCNDDFDLVDDGGYASMLVSMNVTAGTTYMIQVAVQDVGEPPNLGLMPGDQAVLTIKPTPAAGNFAVNSTADAVDSNIGDGICNAAGIGCTLRAAINEANASRPGSNILLSAGTYSLTIPTNYEGAGITGDLDIISTLTITGAGPQATVISGSGSDGVFEFFTGANVTIQGLKIRNGSAGAGGGVRLNETAAVTLDNVWVTENKAAFGGGVTVEGGTLTMTNSAITANVATGGTDISGNGGAIEVRDNADANVTINLTNVTISGNTAVTPNTSLNFCRPVDAENPGSPHAGKGGAVYFGLPSGKTLTANFNNVTIANNTAFCGGGIFTSAGVNIVTRNTLIGDNTATNNPDCKGNIGSAGSNVIENAAGCTTAGTDIVTPDIRLNPLALNAPGSTPTHLTRNASPARDAGHVATCAAVDQRGISRPQAAKCDIGALEALSVAPAPFSLLTPSHDFVVTSATGLTQFTWQRSTNAYSYSVTLDSISNGTPVNVYSGTVTAAAACSPTVCTANFAGSLPDGFYRYQVTAHADTNSTAAVNSHIVQIDSVAGLPNLVTNGGFETKSSNGQALKWNAKGVSGDKRKCDTDTKTFAYKDNCAYRFKGTKLEKSTIRQRLNLSGLVMEKGNSFRFSFYSKYNASIKANVVIKVVYKKASIKPTKVKLVLPPGDQTWTPLSGEVSLKNRRVDRVILIFKHTSKSGTWLIDEVRAVYLDGTIAAREDAVSMRDVQDGLLPPPPAPEGFRGNN